jgi:carbamoyl-phosphate synthase large subunit
MNILLTSAGRRGYLVQYFKEAINGNGKLYVGNSSPISPAFAYADESVVTPLIYSDEYIPFLKEYCIKNNIKAIIPLFDVDLYMLALHKKEFNEIDVIIIVSSVNVVEICNDKWKTYQFCMQNNINTPKTYISLDSAEKAMTKGDIKFPLYIKPRWGMGSIAIFQADNIDELRILYKKTYEEIKNSYLKYESSQNYNECILIQEKLIGQEYGLDVINDLNGNYCNTIVKKKFEMHSGETYCAITEDNKKLNDMGKKISLILHHVANMDIDAFWVGGEPYLLEMNARFGGGYPFSHVAGVNLPCAIIKWLNNITVNRSELEARAGVLSHKDIIMLQLKQNI